MSGEEWVRAKLSMRRVFEKTAEKYGWDKSRKAKADLISFNDMDTMKQHASSIPNGVVTTRQSGNQHYGNPFTHRTGTSATIILPTVKDAVAAYKAWLLGETTFTTSKGEIIDISNVEPERRKWIQDQISSGALDGKTLIYYTTKIGNPAGYKNSDGEDAEYFSDEFPSHAHVLKELVNNRDGSQFEIGTNVPQELSDTILYRGYATMSETDANDLDETVAGTAMDYIDPVFDAGYHFTTSKSEASDYANGRTDKSDETFVDDSGNVVTQRNRHYTGDYAHVTAYKIDSSAKVIHFKDLNEANSNPELLKTADVVVLHQGTLTSSGAMEYIVRKGAKHLVHKIESSNIESSILTPSKEDLPLKVGSVVEYNNELYLVRGFSSNGGLQLIATDGSNFSGTPQPNKVTAVKHQYPVISHNGTDYDNIYTLAKTAKGSRLVYTADASNVGKDRNFLISRAMVQRGQARYHSNQNYIVTESGSVYKTNGELYTADHAQQIARETYPEKFTTQPIVSTKAESKEFELTEGQKKVVSEVVDYLEGRGKNLVICINGAAGTGKTTVIDSVLEQMKINGTLPQDGSPIVVSSISNQATSNLYNKIGSVPVVRQTIASFEGATKVDETAEFKFSEGFAKSAKEFEPAIMFVDEVSMLGKKDFEVLLHHVEEYGMKLVLLGDINQLPPIEKDEKGFDRVQSIVFDEDRPISHVQLTERVRQGKDSPILAYSDLYRTEGKNTNFEKTTTIKDDGAVIFDNGEYSKYISLFVWAKEHSNPNFVKACVPTHVSRGK